MKGKVARKVSCGAAICARFDALRDGSSTDT